MRASDVAGWRALGLLAASPAKRSAAQVITLALLPEFGVSGLESRLVGRRRRSG